MKTFYLFIRNIFVWPQARQFGVMVLAGAITFLLPCRLFAQTVSYSGPQTYNAGASITPLSPGSSNVAAFGYTSPVEIRAGLNGVNAIAIDPSGNIYVSDNVGVENAHGNISNVSFIREIMASNGSVVTLFSDTFGVAGLAFDAAGNLYISDNQDHITEIPAGGSVSTSIQLGSGLSHPMGVAVDDAGNVYVADYTSGYIKKIPAGNGPVQNLGSTQYSPTRVAVDAAGNVFFVSGANIYKIPAGSTVATLFIGGSITRQVGSDTAGDLFIGTSFAMEFASAGSTSHNIIAGGVGDVEAVTTDQSGNVYMGVPTLDDTIGLKKIKPIGGYFISPALPAGLTFDNNTGTISGTPLAASPATNYTVTAYNGSNKTSATVNIRVNNSTNATLSGLTLNPGALSPAFDPSTTSYTAGVGNAVSSITVTPTSTFTVSGITVNGTTVASGSGIAVPLQVGTNSITIVVTAQDGVTQQTYAIVVDRVSTDALLSNLTLSAGTLTPSFTPGTNSYSATVPNTVRSITLTPITSATVATVKINGALANSGVASQPISLNVGANTITAAVTAEDGTTQNTYTVTVTRQIALPFVSYASPQTYMQGTAIGILSPLSSGVASFGFNTPAVVSTGISDPLSMAMDNAGNIYIGEGSSGKVSVLTAGGGVASTFASGFGTVWSVKLDASNDVFVADGAHVWVVPAGSGGVKANIGSFVSPVGLAFDAAGNLYVADNSNSHPGVYKLTSATSAPLRIDENLGAPAYIGFDNNGNLFIGDQASGGLYEIPAGGNQTQVASGLSTVKSLAIDASGNVYVSGSSQIYCYSQATGLVTIKSTFTNGLMVDANQNLYYSDGANINKMSPSGGYFTAPELPQGLTINPNTGAISGTPATVSAAANYSVSAFNAAGSTTATLNITVNVALPTVRYSGPRSYPIGSPILTLFPTSTNVASWSYSSSTTVMGSGYGLPVDVVADATGNIYLADFTHNQVEKIPAGGGAAVVLASGFNAPFGLAIDAAGNLYVADAGNNAIKEIVTGTGAVNIIGSGFNAPAAVAVDALGNVYVADTGNGALKKIPAGNGTPVTLQSGFASIQGVAVDAAGNIYVTDAGVGTSGNGAVYKVPAGGGTRVSVGTGFVRPTAVTVDAGGNLYVADINKSVITVVEPNGTQFTVGSGLNHSNGITFDSSGNLYIADSGTGSVKQVKITGGYFLSPLLPAGLTFNNSTGAITGTPTTASAAADYKVTVQNTSGSGQGIINIAVPSNNASLASMNPGVGPMTPVFNTNVTSYTLNVINSKTSITVAPVASDANATIKVNGSSLVSGERSGAIALSVGSNTINVVVTAADGSTTQTYTVSINRGQSSNAGLASMGPQFGPLSPVFNTNTTSYAITVPNNKASMTVKPVASDPAATITVNGDPLASGSTSNPAALTAGAATTISVAVTAPDGVTTKTYTIAVTRALSSNANLASMGPQFGPLSPVFNANTTSYTISLPNSKPTMTVKPVASDPGATITVNGTAVASGNTSDPVVLAAGSTTNITVVVTAPDGITTKTYIITVNRAPGAADGFDPGLSVNKPAQTPSFDDDVVVVHQGISPNGDGISDFLVIDGIQAYPDNQLVIMNRNGQLIYEAKGYDNSSKVFDGHSNKTGKMQLPGTYFFQLDYTVNGIIKHKTGYLVLKY